MEADSKSSKPDATAGEDEARREALRKSGALFLEKAMAQVTVVSVVRSSSVRMPHLGASVAMLS